MDQVNISKKIVLVLLAAGASRRLGQAKQLLEYNGDTLLRRSAKICIESQVGPLIVVLGHQIQKMYGKIEDLNLSIIENPQWEYGLASSIKAGLFETVKLYPKVEGIIFILCDQLFLNVDVLRQVAQVFTQMHPLYHAIMVTISGPPP